MRRESERERERERVRERKREKVERVGLDGMFVCVCAVFYNINEEININFRRCN